MTISTNVRGHEVFTHAGHTAVAAVNRAWNQTAALGANAVAQAVRKVHSFQFGEINGVEKRANIINLSNVSTYANPEKVREEARTRRDQIIAANYLSNNTGRISPTENFENARPKLDGICAGIRAGIAVKVLNQNQSPAIAASSYHDGADLFAEVFQALYEHTTPVANKEYAIHEHLQHLGCVRASYIACILDRVCGTRLKAQFPLNSQHTLDKVIKPINTDLMNPSNTPNHLQNSINHLQEIRNNNNRTKEEKEYLGYAIAFLIVIGHEDYGRQDEFSKRVHQLFGEFQNVGISNYLHSVDKIKIQGSRMGTSALSPTNTEFLSKMTDSATSLVPGFYGINLKTNDFDHAISLCVLNDGQHVIIDPNGIVLLCATRQAAKNALIRLVSIYSPPGEGEPYATFRATGILSPSIKERDNHQISILSYDRTDGAIPFAFQ